MARKEEMKMEEGKPRYLEDWLSLLDQKLDMILEELGSGAQRMSVKDIAKLYGIPRQKLYTSKRYLLPDFGEGLGEGRTYTREEVLMWKAKGEDRLYREWKERKSV